MSFVAIDLTLFALFTLITIVFLYTHKKNLQRQGILYLYRTRIGLKIIEYTAKKFPRTLKALEYVMIVSGFILMVSMIWLLAKFSYTYITSAFLAQQIKIPVLLPLFPYVSDLFKIDFLPPFYFTYWVIIIAIVAIPHEFFHGIFARLNKIKVHSTGFGFLGPFLAFFVEPDEKQMAKAKKIPQMAILASGTFANLLVTGVFLVLMWLFFSLSFAPAGLEFNTYALTPINTSDVTGVSNVTFGNITYGEINAYNKTFFISAAWLPTIINKEVPYFFAFDDSPAFNAQIKGVITEVDGQKITSKTALTQALAMHNPGDSINVKTLSNKGKTENNYDITLGNNNGNAFLGVGFIPSKPSGLLGWFYSISAKVKTPGVYYTSKIGEFGIFINDMLWWLVIINISVALMNMLPLGIFDGGRFFYLAVWGLTGSRKIGEGAFKISTWLLLGLIIALMLKWAFAVF